jgi:zinc protease
MPNRFQTSLIALILGSIFASAQVFAQERQASLQTARLANGIRVVVEEDRSVPVFAIQAWIRVGSMNESEDQAGLAHLLEHMLFRRVMPPGSELGKLAEQVESAGGDINAFTSPDCTVVHLVLPAEAAEKGLRAIASVFSAPEFDPRDLEEEKKVVIEEINRSEDLPEGLLMKRLFSESFWVHPYGRPVIGSRESVERFTVQDLKSFFLNYYRPERIVISATGDASMEKVIKGLEEAFKVQNSRFKVKTSNAQQTTPDCRRSAAACRTAEPTQTGFRRQVLRGRWEKAYLNLAFHVGGVNDERVAAIDLMASILGEGTDSKLRRELEEKRRRVYSISASSYTPADPGLLIIQAELDPGRVPRVIPAILEEVNSLRRGEIRPEELKRAQAQITSGYFRAGESREGRAGQLGFLYSLTPGISYENKYLQKVNQVTVEKIRQAAEKYLRIGNLTAVVLVPEKSLPGFSEADLDVELADSNPAGAGGKEKHKIPGSGKVVEQNDSGMKVLFPNGLRLIVREKPGSGTVAVVAAFRGGLLAESPGQEGISNLMAELLPRGTSRLGLLGIAEKTKLLGGELEAFSGWQSLGLKAEFLASNWFEGLELMTEIVQTPTFSDSEIDKLKEKIAAAIRSRDENLLQLAFIRLREALYGSGPYGHDILGSLTSIPLITRDDIQDFYQEVVRPENLVISIVGNINSREVISQAAGLWGGWEPEEVQGSRFLPAPRLRQAGKVQGSKSKECEKAGNRECLNAEKHEDKTTRQTRDLSDSGLSSLPAFQPSSGIKELRFPVPGSKQVNLVWGFPGTTFFSPDRFPLEVLDAILSGQSGRLFRNIRDQEGLAYMIGSSVMTGVEPGFFALYLATSPERESNAVKAVENELADLAGKAISDEELKKAKACLIGNFEVSRQTNPKMAQAMALDEIYGLGFDYAPAYINNLKEVDIGTLKKVIVKYLDKNSFIMIKVGAAKE